MPTVPELTWHSMTAAVREIKSPASFLTNLLFSAEFEQDTEQLEYSVLHSDRSMAPFVKKNGRSEMVGGLTEKFYAVEPPNIRISRPMEASQTFFKRRPGTVVFPSADQQYSAIQEAIANDLARMTSLVDNRIEWLVAMAMRGAISYETDGNDAWEITFPRAAGHSIALTGTNVWDNAASKPHEDFLDAKDLINESTGLNPTHAIMSRTAFDAFRNNADVANKLDNRRMAYGELRTSRVVNGAVYGGMYEDVEIWCYTRSLKDTDGTMVPLIRDKYVEFVTAAPEAENHLYYGAIADWKAYNQGSIRTRRFSKSWEEEDPSALMALLQSRPLPVPRRPDSMVSMQVLA